MVTTRAKEALRVGLLQVSPSAAADMAGYVLDFRDNLLPGVDPVDFEVDLRQGRGNELEGKFRAAHSSSALAVNCFAPFRQRTGQLRLGAFAGFNSLRFEAKCPTGLGGTPPHLDVLVDGAERVVGIESKCTEPLSTHTAAFSPAYRNRLDSTLREGVWFAEMLLLHETPAAYRWLDAAQLIKHAFGLARTYSGRHSVLLYLFWEPSNARSFPIFRQHREEIAEFSHRVQGSSPAFSAMSYDELWQEWADADPPAWLSEHLARLRTRYDVAI
jgi:hypothetical protein